MKTIRIISILCIAFSLSGQSSEDDSLDATFEKDVLVISASEHACYRFDIYVATTRAQQARGLMYVRYLPDSTGMLFVYRQARVLYTTRHPVYSCRRFDCQYRDQHRAFVVRLDSRNRAAELCPGTECGRYRTPADRYGQPRALPW
jgi:hypothetical protein